MHRYLVEKSWLNLSTGVKQNILFAYNVDGFSRHRNSLFHYLFSSKMDIVTEKQKQIRD